MAERVAAPVLLQQAVICGSADLRPYKGQAMCLPHQIGRLAAAKNT